MRKYTYFRPRESTSGPERQGRLKLTELGEDGLSRKEKNQSTHNFQIINKCQYDRRCPLSFHSPIKNNHLIHTSSLKDPLTGLVSLVGKREPCGGFASHPVGLQYSNDILERGSVWTNYVPTPCLIKPGQSKRERLKPQNVTVRVSPSTISQLSTTTIASGTETLETSTGL